MLAPAKLRGRVTAGEGVADTRAGEPERLRERPDHDDVVLDQVDCAHARVLEVRLVDDERPRVG